MPDFFDSHLSIQGRTEALAFTSPNQGRSNIIPRTGLNRIVHGESVKLQFTNAVTSFDPQDEREFVYLVFRSPPDLLIDLEKLDKGNFRLASYREIRFSDADRIVRIIYEAAVYLNRAAISQFLRKVEDYIHRTTPITYNEDGTVKGGGNPFNLSLVANIDEIRAATLISFWQEPEIEFPSHQEAVWWEVWLSRDVDDPNDNPLQPLLNGLAEGDVQIGQRYLVFPEHHVYLMRGTSLQLGRTILYSNRLAEVRKPRDTADFFTYLDVQEQHNWINDLVSRIDFITDSTVAVCLLDTGVNNAHPLLVNVVPNRNLDSIEPAWSKADTHPHGHGTGMAGLALYGDLTEIFAKTHRVTLFHHLESIKLIEIRAPNLPQLYGALTMEAVARAEIINPAYKRIVCMAVTSDAFVHKGKPSSWSSAIDQMVFGTSGAPNTGMLFFVSSGNIPQEERVFYPIRNGDFSIEDPAQAFNAITVGAYTLKDFIDQQQYPGASSLAAHGDMAPCNTTSASWEAEWCRKPDIVMEGGNQGIQNNALLEPDSLLPLTTSKGGVGRSLLTTFGDTSCATALASKFAAELYYTYPNYSPETIRALIIHSADWTPAMLGNRPISALTSPEKILLFSKVGYGVPNLHKAKYSANNSLSMIIEREFKPYKFQDGQVKTNEFHLLDLPWPVDELQQLFDAPVKLKLTLSYFIEPNPGAKQYEKAANYRSFGLRFKMIDSNESLPAFKARISRTMRDQQPFIAEGAEHWILGSAIRDKGSIHKDIWEGTAADLSTRSNIAIYPVGGWWKFRKKHHRYDTLVRYSLVMTIEVPSIDGVDIYTPIRNLISLEIEP